MFCRILLFIYTHTINYIPISRENRKSLLFSNPDFINRFSPQLSSNHQLIIYCTYCTQIGCIVSYCWHHFLSNTYTIYNEYKSIYYLIFVITALLLGPRGPFVSVSPPARRADEGCARRANSGIQQNIKMRKEVNCPCLHSLITNTPIIIYI
jgi:hypothetical protein